MKTLIGCVLLAILAGCASTLPVYENYKASDAACVRGQVANVFRFFSADAEAHTGILEINGVASGGGRGPFCLPPGKHTLGIYGGQANQSAQGFIEVELRPTQQYALRGNLRGLTFVFRLVDVTTEPERLVQEFRLTSVARPPSTTVPIFIPVR